MEYLIVAMTLLSAGAVFIAFYIGKNIERQKLYKQIQDLKLAEVALAEKNLSINDQNIKIEVELSEAEKKNAELSSQLMSEKEARASLSGQISELLPLKELVRDNSSRIDNLEKEKIQLTAELANEKTKANDRIELMTKAKEEFTNHFEALCAKSLNANNDTFLKTAHEIFGKYQESAKGDLEKRQLAIENTLKPVRETLETFGSKISEIEKARVGAYEGLTQQVKGLIEIQNGLRNALAAPKVRGRWGEIQLRRVVELAGMLNYCDFLEQQTSESGSGPQRPDLIVKLAGGKNIIVDAKAPLSAYLEAHETNDEAVRIAKFKDHARQVRDHVNGLSKKQYWEQFNPTPEFVILFLPGENFYNVALEYDGSLIEHGVENKVIIATPVTLISILKAIAYGWQQQAVAENAQEISALGKELYKRISTMSDHFGDVGNKLNKAVESYNKTVSTLESRVLVTGRRFRDLNTSLADSSIEILNPIELSARQLEKIEEDPA